MADFSTYQAAHDSLPTGARISSTFGFPADDGYQEAWRAPEHSTVFWITREAGDRYTVKTRDERGALVEG